MVAARAGATQEEMRRHNLSMLLSHVHESGSMSRAELTALMGLNRSTIKGLVSELTAAGLVEEVIPDTRLGAGRPSHVVVPREDAAYALAANVGVERVDIAAVALGGAVLARKSYRNTAAGTRPATLLTRLARELDHLTCATPAGSWPAAVGVGVPGVVRATDGHVEIAPNLAWRDVPLAQMLRELLTRDIPVFVGNDGNLGALAEHTRGAARGVDNAIFVAGEVGVGGGIVVDGSMLQGAGGYAGELGHMMVNPRGRVCRCGSIGCWETEIGEDGLLIAAGSSPGTGRAGVDAFIARAAAGEPAAVAALDERAVWIGRGLASLANIFNPEVIILGGLLAQVFTATDSTVRATVDRYAMPTAGGQLTVGVPGLGQDVNVVGAAELALQSLLRDPVEALSLRAS